MRISALVTTEEIFGISKISSTIFIRYRFQGFQGYRVFTSNKCFYHNFCLILDVNISLWIRGEDPVILNPQPILNLELQIGTTKIKFEILFFQNKNLQRN